MTTSQISLPDDLAATARDAGLLDAEVVQGLLQQELRRQALGDPRQAWADMEPAELTSDIESMPCGSAGQSCGRSGLPDD